MNRKKDVMLFILVLLISFISCKDNSNDPEEILKKRIDNAEMIEYIDSCYIQISSWLIQPKNLVMCDFIILMRK